MTSEPNLLNRITITIEANNQQVAKKVLHGSVLNQTNIHKILNSYFDEYNIHQDISLEALALNLGEINSHDFNSLFPARLKEELNKALSQYQINDHKEEILLNKSISSHFINKLSLSGDNNFINAENFIHSLYQQDPQLNTLEAISNNKEINRLIHQLAQIENQWILLLAKSCLSEHGIQRLLAIKQPTLLNAINRRLSARVNKPLHQEELVSSAQWLDTVITQLPGWKKLSRNDVLQLFLQRPGELRINDQEIKIIIQQQPFDALLTEWPWPLNIAKFPWLDRALLIDWQNI
ncbi:contractile injection system tape measure protein [Photorhabdus sp. CRCIA-P01]|uniref:contractile injection system tape measure protein n=1 Tax=Photorhabdus sp. CRCIA-P01 TaxID=2019570 RepID=UPI000E59EE7C|nr:contractile injection system tape measure protein [Photorhabdus sp. CRCIA-P01]